MTLKIKKRKKLEIKKRPLLEIKRRKKRSSKEINAYYSSLKTVGRKRCAESLCPQGVYSSESNYCYFHEKLRKGLIDAPIY